MNDWSKDAGAHGASAAPAAVERAAPAETAHRQLGRLNRLLEAVLPRNRFYAARLGSLTLPLSWDDFRRLPFTVKSDLVEDQRQHPPLGTIATYPRESYVAYHQTSGTSGRSLTVLDTAESWEWWSECWQYVYRGAGVRPEDRIFFAFSFGPFIGFWSAFAAARRLGALTLPGGGLDSKGRLAMIRDTGATVLVSTVTYALRLAEVAREMGLDLRTLGVGKTIHAGEPGASIPSVRARIEEAWGARCYDHAGATEVGAWGFTCEAQDGLHVNEAEFVAELLVPGGEAPAAPGEAGELVLTGLGRPGWPVVRYRTGDLARRAGDPCPCGRTFLKLPGGVIGRVDDLMIVRGINVYPSAIEAIVREHSADEFRIVRSRRDAMDELLVEVEGTADTARRLREALRQRLGIRVETREVAAGTLPRFDLKARRVVDRRDAAGDRP